MSLGPQGGRSLLATMWRLAIARQQLLLVALALVLIDASAVAAAIGALEQADTFANFASAIFDESRTLADALDRAVGGNWACAAAVALYVFVRPWPLAWIRASYIRALATTGGFPRPAWPSVVRLVLLDVCIGTPLAFGIGILEKADLPEIGPPVLLAVLVFTLYADYAIVIDDLGLLAGVPLEPARRAAPPGCLARRHRRLADALVRARALARALVRQRRDAAHPDRAPGRHGRARLRARRLPDHALPRHATAAGAGRASPHAPLPASAHDDLLADLQRRRIDARVQAQQLVTVVPNCVAIEASVSPGLTVHFTCWPALPSSRSWSSRRRLGGRRLRRGRRRRRRRRRSSRRSWPEAAAAAGGGTGCGCGGGGSGGGAVCGTGSVSTGPPRAVDDRRVPVGRCARARRRSTRISVIAVTAPSSAAGAR